MLRTFWDEAIALDPKADAKDERHMPLSRAGELAALWRPYLENVSETALRIETRFSSFEDYWSPFLLQQGPAGVHVATLSTDDIDQLQSRLRRRLLVDRGDGPITLDARAWAVRGVVPSGERLQGG